MRLKITDSGMVEYEDGRVLIEPDQNTDKPGELEQVVRQVNAYDYLKQLLIDRGFTDARLESLITRAEREDHVELKDKKIINLTLLEDTLRKDGWTMNATDFILDAVLKQSQTKGE